MSVQVLLDRAKASGLNVSLESGKLKVRAAEEPQGEIRALIHELREHREDVLEALAKDDTIVTRDIVMDEFRRLHEGVIKFELRDFDYGWLRENQLDLYATIKAKEAELYEILYESRRSKSRIRIVGPNRNETSFFSRFSVLKTLLS